MYLGTVMFCLHLVFSTVARLPLVWRLGFLRRMVEKGTLQQGEFYAAVHRAARGWAKAQLRWSGTRAAYIGLENIPADKPVVFVANHQSDFDVALLLECLEKPLGFIAKVSIKKIPIAGKALEFMGGVFMDRDDMRQSVKAILEGVKIVGGGQNMAIFPEGTRRRDNPTGEFKAGALKLATKAKAYIVPVTIDGSENIYEINKGHIKRAKPVVTFHKPIDTALLTKDEAAAIHETVREIIVNALREPR